MYTIEGKSKFTVRSLHMFTHAQSRDVHLKSDDMITFVDSRISIGMGIGI